MISDVIQFVVFLLILVPGVAAEEMLPKVLGVGFPILLTSVQFVSLRLPLPPSVLFAVAAGAAEDAVCSLPPMTSGSFFLLAALLARWSRLPWLTAVLVAAGYQAWLAVWMVGLGGGVFVRILVALPIGLVTALSVHAALSWTWRKAAIDERG